ncbi:hypothetical protein BTA51_15090 [Hahella sp. CCB-MM4]|uniref:serine/threonine protein kinase n=1 Tax=Hahella sp. (strain CCB-MM4) TaxID=1926491 RepID=UPI000B9ADBCA|nr:protein kinase [Hahella sp. CCB-MM4]OZG72450.1 hypothetical protein BTA51_15090 [Hahella sp. CCB-MM4]
MNSMESSVVRLQSNSASIARGKALSVGGTGKGFSVGQIVNDRYLLVEKSCSSGAFVVFKAQDLWRLAELGQEHFLAFKTLKNQWIDCREAVNTLLCEGDMLHKIQHESVIRSFISGNEDGIPFLLLEWHEGRTLENMMKDSHYPLSAQVKRRIIWQLVAVVGSLHRQGIVHGDIQPANIVIRPDGRLYLNNFGAACLDNMAKLPQRLYRALPDFVIKNHDPTQAPKREGDWYAILQVLRCLYFGGPRTRMRPKPGLTFFQIRALRKALWKLERKKMPDIYLLDEVFGVSLEQLSTCNLKALTTDSRAQQAESDSPLKHVGLVFSGLCIGVLSSQYGYLLDLIKEGWTIIS